MQSVCQFYGAHMTKAQIKYRNTNNTKLHIHHKDTHKFRILPESNARLISLNPESWSEKCP